MKSLSLLAPLAIGGLLLWAAPSDAGLGQPTPMQSRAFCAPSSPLGISFAPGVNGAIEVSVEPKLAGTPFLRFEPQGVRLRAGSLAWEGAGSRTLVFGMPDDGPRPVYWYASMPFQNEVIRDEGVLWIGAGEIPAPTIVGADYSDGMVTMQAVMQ